MKRNAGPGHRKNAPNWYLVVGLGIATRAVTVAYMYPPFSRGWGGEMPAVAESIARGDGFASPYLIATGPTALVPPVYPYLLSVIFRLFGPHTVVSGVVALGLNVMLSALVAIPLYFLTAKLCSVKTAIVVSWVWAVLPIAGYTDALFVWNTSLYTLTLTTLLAAIVAAPKDHSRRWWACCGALTGFLIVLEPISLTVVGVAFLWLVYRRVPLKTLLTACAAAALLPACWTARNIREFHQPVFLRSGFGLELSSGVRSFELAGDLPTSLPNRNPVELEKYRSMGELDYFRSRQASALEWIRQHPRQYAIRVIKRGVGFWTGHNVSRPYLYPNRFASVERALFVIPAIGAFVGVLFVEPTKRTLVLGILILYPIAFYFTHVELRQRFPIDPLLLALTIYGAEMIWKRFSLLQSISD